MGLRSARPEFGGTRRFQVVRVVGVGGMGVVYEAFDRERKGRVALKILRNLGAEARLRFKNEFRSLQDIQHPNLVSLGELHEEEGQLFFTMELIRGVDFVVHVRLHEEGDASPREAGSGGPRASMASSPMWAPNVVAPAEVVRIKRPFHEARLRSALAQLAQGLAAVHAACKVHRDIKPSNVLVTADERVVVLDFGFVADASVQGREHAVVGTLHYMAPEQAEGKPAGPEADIYSVGVMLYLALTGVYPFQTAPKAALDMMRRAEPPPPSRLVEDMPPDIDALCVDMLRIDPAARPSARDVLRRLRVQELIEEPPVLSQRIGFVGRQRELAALEGAFAEAKLGRAVTRILEGESGVGKSALLRRFLERVDKEALVLSGRCYEREAVPYKAVDEVIDALSRHLSRRPPEEVRALLPPNAGLLGTVFPVLRTVPAITEARARRKAIDPPEIRALVFTALRELLGRLAAERPLVLAIDDLQWADADSVALLSEIMRPWTEADQLAASRPGSTPGLDAASPGAPFDPTRPRAVLLVAAVRTASETSPPLSRQLGVPIESLGHIVLHRLSLAEAQELCALLLRGAPAGRPLSIEAIAQEAGGHPLFIDALLRHRMAQENDGGPVRLDDVLWARISRLDARARQLLELVVCAGAPVLTSVAAHAMAADFAELTRLLSSLRAANLLRTGGSGQDEFVEPFHNRIRETVNARLDEQTSRTWNGRLALALEASGRGELEALAEHWRAAGDAQRAAGYAVRAGEQAEAAFAFDHAARLYRMAIDLHLQGGTERRLVLAKLGDALSSAGRGAKAAEAYMAASDGAPEAEAIDLGRRAAENLLRAGYVDAGMAGMRSVLSAVGMQVPKTPELAVASLMLRRAQVRLRGLNFVERPAEEVPPEDLMRIDVCWSAALGLAIVDPTRGADFQARNLLLSLKAGEPYRVTRALSFEASYLAVDGGPSAPRVADLLSTAGGIAARIGRPHALGLVAFVGGVAATLFGRWQQGLADLDRADTIFRERCTGVTWERSWAHTFAVWALWYGGGIREFMRRVPMYLQAADERGDRYLATSLRSSQSNTYWLIGDDPDSALRQAQDAIRSWSKAGFQLQSYFDLVARAHIGLYRGEGEATHRLFAEQRSGIESSLALRIQAVRVIITHLRACAALCAASAVPPAEAEVLYDEAARAARKIEAEHMPWGDALAAAVRAAVAASHGEAELAAQQIAEAVRGFDAAGMALYAAAARRRQGELLKGDEGRAAALTANGWMQEQGIVSPDRMTAMLLPGFPG
ncbi:ATPase AAA [Sorangium cellulosum]|uniref:non-specific serine/threonine protein kinase n=1 Tax=Sorangium cellulosum TaxID=56 RepID=A0A2L0FC72_SORCE|nr:serine/threonine-protein kinase [Sorangium cellulosum]AUX49029.1 ATPase AAA [Sorangium cellulosum]